MNSLLKVEHLTVDIPTRAGLLHPVRDVSFEVSRGETLCIVGESGCGKSLTSLALMDLLPRGSMRKAARLTLENTDLSAIDERDMARVRGNRMAMIFQEPMTSLNPAYSIGNQLEESLLQHKAVSRREARDRAVFLLEKVGIPAAAGRLKQYPHQLSGGLRQRVMIAMALMCGPDLIIADEPTTALDVTIQAQILHLLAGLQQEFEMGMILITHDLGIVARVAHKVCVMYAGQFVEQGSVEEVFRNPLHPYTRGLLECIPIPGKTPPGSKLGSIPGIVPSLVGTLAGCSFRERCAFAHAACVDDVALHFVAGENRACRCVMTPGGSTGTGLEAHAS